MEKLKMTTPLVELDGDEMTRILWKAIKEELLEPFVELNTEYYDLGLPNREATGDQVTVDSAHAIKRYGVGVKCATITPNAQRVEEYKLSQMWKSPNGTIRAILDGTVFRAPIMVKGISPVVKNWKAPITIARHAYGDVYKATELPGDRPGQGGAGLYRQPEGRRPAAPSSTSTGPGVLQGQYNKDDSITSFARSCFQYALDTRQDLWFSTKDTISKQYDHTFKDIFARRCTRRSTRPNSRALGISYFYTLIDDAVARVIRSRGRLYLGLQELRRRCDERHGVHRLRLPGHDDLRAGQSPEGNYEYEAAHGTVTQHYYRHLKGEQTSTNSVATIFAWTGALAKRGELDRLPALTELCPQAGAGHHLPPSKGAL